MNLLAGFGKRQVLLALGFCIPLQAAHLMYAVVEQKEMQLWLIGLWIVFSFLFALLGLACAVATDNLLGDSAGTAMRMVVALVVAAGITTLASELLVYVMPAVLVDEETKMMGGYASTWHRIAFRFVTSGDTALLLIPLYTMMQANRRATARLHDTQLSAIAAERQVVEADLRAMQARVEPDLLFAALQAVDEAYARDVEEGERALDALISFLRAALPADASGNSTVAAEVELVRAYLALVELVSASHLKLDVAVEAPAQARAMPAMLLLPLVRWVLGGAAQASLSMDARVRAERLEVTLHSDLDETAQRHAQPAEKQDISGLQDRLARLFAGRALLEASPGPDGRGARLEIPLFA